MAMSVPGTAQAQRVIFPTPVDNATPPAVTPQVPSSAPVYTAQPPAYAGTPTSPSPYLTQPVPGSGPVYTAPPAYSGAPGSVPSLAQFDPYASGAQGSAPPAYAAAGPAGPAYNNGFIPTAIRLLQEVRFQETWIPRTGGGNDSFGINNDELYASFGIPFFSNPAPILITPGFNFHFLSGPNSEATVPDRDLPPTVYDAYIASAWRPQITQRFAMDLALSVGLYTDFQYVSTKSIRVLGRGIGLYTLSPQWTLAAGVIYLNRISVKLLPAGGVIWTPHPDARYEILFPNPKLAQRITTWGNIDLWGYVAGEYGGGQWSIRHADGSDDVVNYNDFRVMLGVEGFYTQRWRGNFEVGYVFNRQILYLIGPQTVSPGDSVMLRAGLSY
ncbi:MAG TPA: DUF6268 family outer membrane beta-barrel protein [Pirellulales bacterium]|nr:DUF6268 family outer membrane beta-barrel protein [Pirellulales bacterium]